MPTIPGFWLEGTHDPLPVEATWREFVQLAGGELVSDHLSGSPGFENADYFFPAASVVAELKEIETEFSKSRAFLQKLDELLKRLLREDPNWRPPLLGGDGKYPGWFPREFVRIFRPPISRILKKANRQIRETKDHLGIQSPTGILLLVNDGFTNLGPDLIRALACNLLMNTYSSIDCFVYLTLNRYVEIVGSNVPRLLWIPTYSDRAQESLVDFVNSLGRSWFTFLEGKIGPFTVKNWETQDGDIIKGSKSIVLPDEKRS
jgi:hypothetical protein